MGHVTRQGGIAAEGVSMSSVGNDGGFFSGWSRRKLEAKRQEPVEKEIATPDQEGADTPPEVVADDAGLDADQIAALPSLDDITAGTDIKPFLAKGVPASLKNAALRRLWSASPSVRDYADPAVDYAWDWNAPGGVPGGGGILSDKSVAKMVKDLIGKAPEEEEDEEVVPNDADFIETDDAAQNAETDPALRPLEAVRRSDHAKKYTQPAQQSPDVAPRAQVQTTADPPRRHGSAMPE